MALRIAFLGLMLGALALIACGSPQAPTPLPPPQTAAPPPTVSPPTSGPPAPPSGSTLPGLYTMTLTIGPSCNAVPDGEKTRRYSASIEYSREGRYIVTLGDSAFLSGSICTFGSGRFSGMGCNQFFAGEDIDEANFFLENNNDEGHGGHIVEQTASGTWMEIIGHASGRLSTPSIEASGTASVWYCPTPVGYPFPCTAFVSCNSTDIRISLTRK